MLKFLNSFFHKGLKAKPDVQRQVFGNPGARHPYEVVPGTCGAGAVSGMEFVATLQLRTPLYILQRHGQSVPIGTKLLDDFEPWMGIWIPKLRDPLEFGVPALSEPYSSSDVGPVQASTYLPFLINLRSEFEEKNKHISEKIGLIRKVCENPQHYQFVKKHGGVDCIIRKFFPRVVDLIPNISSKTRESFATNGITSVQAIKCLSDAELLKIDGIGPAKLASIRDFCVHFQGDENSEFVEATI